MRKLMTATLSGALLAGGMLIGAGPALATMDEYCNKFPGDSACIGGVTDRDAFYDRRNSYRDRGYHDRRDRAHYRDRDFYDRRDRGDAAAGALFGLAAGAILGEIFDDDHYTWCRDRYRSYRRHDNTWRPYKGSRRVCASPFS